MSEIALALQNMDPYDFAEPVDVLSALGKSFWDGLAAEKWSERRDALQQLKVLVGCPQMGH